jgi:hypothetical protein
MTNCQLEQVHKLFDELSRIDKALNSDSNNNYYLEMDETKSSVQIIGNTAGFIHLATSILELALTGIDGNHYHFGEGALENCDKELEVLYKSYKYE